MPERLVVGMGLGVCLPPGRVIDQHHSGWFADYLTFILSHYDPGSFIKPNPKQRFAVVRLVHFTLRIREYLCEVQMPKAGDHVLVNRCITQEAKTMLMITKQDAAAIGVPAHQVGSLDCRPCRAAANDSTTGKYFVKCLFGPGAGIRVSQSPLSTAREPHRIGLLQWLNKFFRICLGSVMRV